ncbi:MAG: hypothetical protein ABIC82_03930 [bacterium]
MKTYQKYTIFTFILGILVLFASYSTTVSVILPIIGLIYIITVAYCLGKFFFDCQELIERTILGLLIEIFVVMIVGSVFFYCYALNNVFFIATTLGFPVLIFFLERKSVNKKCLTAYHQPPLRQLADTLSGGLREFPPNKVGKRGLIGGDFRFKFSRCAVKFDLSSFILISTYLISTSTLFYILISHSTLLPIRTPWEVIPKYFFAIFFINTLALTTILLGKKDFKIINYKLILTSIYLFLFFNVAYFIYRLGYGFDPFIHRATLDVILKTGTITPKPFYYIGEYSLVFYLSKLLGANINILEKILVPLSSAIFLPAALYYYLNKKFQSNNNWLIILSLLLMPVVFLIVTTPQNLANLLLIILIIFSLNYSRSPAPQSPASRRGDCGGAMNIFLILNVLAIFFIHPISGIPAILFLILLFLWRKAAKTQEIQNTKFKILNTKYGKLFIILTCLGLISFPTIWLFNSIISPQTAVTINSKILAELILYLQNLKLLSFGNLEQFKIILNIIYFFYFNLPIILIAVFVFILRKIYQEKKAVEYVPYLISFLIFFLNYLILKIFINFGFLIDYEQDNYTNRVLQISILFLIPFFLIFIDNFWGKVSQKNFIIKYVLIIILPICLCASLYFTYPRHDNFTASHGYNTSKYDIMAVDYIDKNSKKDFIVLANQQVSAAALQEFGFKKYYDTCNGKLFYYPIPTGNALYQYYLEMVNKKPAKETMESAMKLTDVKEGYFIVNKYWFESKRIVDLAKLVSDEYVIIGDDDVYIFKFTMANTPMD